MKNIIFIPYIKREENLTGKSSIGHSNRHQGYEYGINSWKAWAEKNGHEVYIMSDLLCPESQMLITWQRWQVLNILEHNEIEYDQVLVVDADSIVHPDCPNFFEMTDRKFTSPLTDGDFEWMNRAINGYSKMFFDKVFEFYETNRQKIIESYDILLTGSDITLMNCLRKEFGVELNTLPRQFGMMDMVRKNLFYYHPQCWWKDELDFLYNSGWVYQFNAIPKNDMGRDRTYWMKRVYEELYK